MRPEEKKSGEDIGEEFRDLAGVQYPCRNLTTLRMRTKGRRRRGVDVSLAMLGSDDFSASGIPYASSQGHPKKEEYENGRLSLTAMCVVFPTPSRPLKSTATIALRNGTEERN